MKQLLNSILLAVVLIMMVLSVTAQEEKQNNTTVKPKWVLEKGYWVAESNIIHFYNNQNRLVYSGKLEGVILKLKKRKILVKLC